MTLDEGYVKYASDWQLGPALAPAEIAELNSHRIMLFDAGLIGQYSDVGVGFGNISMRHSGGGKFVISGTQTGHIRDTGPEHYSLVTDYDIDRNFVRCQGPVQASSEALTHAAIYELGAAINAVVHVHSAKLWSELRDRLPTTAASVPYGTPEMAREFARLHQETSFADVGIAVMAGHEDGLVSIGIDIETATTRMLALTD